MAGFLTVTVAVDRDDVARAKRRFETVGASAVDALAAALTAEAQRAINVSRPLVPVDTGVLRGSGVVLPAEKSGSSVKVVAGYGGAASAYAAIQHETLSFAHTVGQARYLAAGVKAALPGAGQRVAAVIAARTKG